MTELEQELIDQLFFIMQYAELLKDLQVTEPELDSALHSLLQKGLIDQYQFDSSVHDFVLVSQVELHNLQPYAYLANKEGLLKYTIG